jgi:hypothetical protein
MYSLDDLKSLVSDKITPTDAIIRVTEELAFRVGDIVQHATTIVGSFLALTIDESIDSLWIISAYSME